jgi:hypothetical protein
MSSCCLLTASCSCRSFSTKSCSRVLNLSRICSSWTGQKSSKCTSHKHNILQKEVTNTFICHVATIQLYSF